MHMRPTVIWGISGSAIFFLHYLINGTIFETKALTIKCVFWFSVQLLYKTFLVLKRTERDMINNIYRSSCEVPGIFVRFYWNLNLLDRLKKNTQLPNFMNIRLLGAESFHADRRLEGQVDRRTDNTKLTVAFRNFTKSHKYLQNFFSGVSETKNRAT